MRYTQAWGMGVLVLGLSMAAAGAKELEKVQGPVEQIDTAKATFVMRPEGAEISETIKTSPETQYVGLASLAELQTGQTVRATIGEYHPVLGDWHAVEVQVIAPAEGAAPAAP